MGFRQARNTTLLGTWKGYFNTLLEFATIEALEYSRAFKKREGVKAVYIASSPTRSEVVRAKVLTRLYGIPVSVVQYSYNRAKIQYQICV